MADILNSIRVSAGTRVYYFDIKEDSKGQQYLSIAEVPTENSPGIQWRERVFIHADHLANFVKALNEIAAQMLPNVKVNQEP